MDPGYTFNVNDNAEHSSFTFDVTGSDVNDLTTDIVTAGFTDEGLGTYHQPPFGKGFDYAIDYKGGAKQGKDGGTLDFYLSDSEGNLTIADLLTPGGSYDGAGIAFSADVYSSVFKGTGNVGAIPEPATWSLMILGIGLAGRALRQVRRKRAFLAA